MSLADQAPDAADFEGTGFIDAAHSVDELLRHQTRSAGHGLDTGELEHFFHQCAIGDGGDIEAGIGGIDHYPDPFGLGAEVIVLVDHLPRVELIQFCRRQIESRLVVPAIDLDIE